MSELDLTKLRWENWTRGHETGYKKGCRHGLALATAAWGIVLVCFLGMLWPIGIIKKPKQGTIIMFGEDPNGGVVEYYSEPFDYSDQFDYDYESFTFTPTQ